MYHPDKQDTPQQWSVHAEVTISHNPPNDGNNSSAPQQAGVAHTEQSGNGLRMVYTWTSHPPEPEYNNYRSSAPSSSTVFQNSDTASRSSAQSFQRGGLVFTSVPPRQTNPFDPNRLNANVQDSGYNSELLSPSSCGATSFSRRPIIPYNRRCRSTCSIILSTAFNADGHNLKCDTSAMTQPVSYHQCGRTQSLRCQTPTIKPERRDSYFGCGDPWCYHADDLSQRRCSPVLESCEECSLSNQSVGSNKRAARANTFTTHFCTRVPERNRSSPPSFDYRSKDMASQTVETSEKCTSPFEKMSMSPFGKPQREQVVRRKSSRKLSDRRRSGSDSRRNSDNTLSPSTLPADTADNKKSSKRITRSPAVQRGVSPLLDKKSPIRDTQKKQRTVHIDVYCTGSDCESESESDSDSEAGTQSSPQTVFESEKVRLSHRRAGSSELPYSLRNFLKENIAGGTIQDEQRKRLADKLPIKRNSDSEEDVSTAYPSALSSYSQIRDFRDFESSMSSVPPSWSAMSTSSCTVPDGYDSVAATSCKDTVSDFESLVLRKFSLAPDESEYFIPRRLQSADTGSDVQDRASTASILPSDSFEYDDTIDRERIKLMEKMWGGGDPDQKTWKSPSSERKYMLQQQKMKEYLEKRVKEKIEAKPELKESETESTEDDSERGWSFVRSTDDKTGLKRDGTVRRASKDALEDDDQKTNSNENKSASVPKIQGHVEKREQVPSLKNNKNPPELPTPSQKTDNTENTKSPPQLFSIQPSSSCTVIGLQRFDSKVRTPFTILPGKYTEPLFKAQKFGTVIGAIRKPGHHVGPAKNPDCLCDHCRRFYEDSQTRSRTRSMGDNSTELPYSWRELLKPRITSRKNIVSDF